MIEQLFEIGAVRLCLSLFCLTRGFFFLLIGNSYRASVDYCWLHRVSDLPYFQHISFRVIRTLVPTLSGAVATNKILDSYLRSSAARSLRKEAFASVGGTDRLSRDLIVLKPSKPNEPGVLLIKYTASFQKVATLLDMEMLFERYRVVLEPSWAGVSDPAILMFASSHHDVIVQTAEAKDFAFLRDLGSRLRPIQLGSGMWTDPGVFSSGPVERKEYDLVMVANWAKYKQHRQLFRALSRIQHRQLRLLLIGFPWGKRTSTDIRREMRGYDLRHVKTTILENISASEVSAYLGRSRVFLHLSRKEGMNKALPEAFFANVPAIVYEKSIGGARSMINERTGVLSSYGDLPRTILSMLERFDRFSPRSWALENIGSERSTERLSEFLRQIAADRGEKWTDDIVEKTNSPNLTYKGDPGEAASELAQIWTSYRRSWEPAPLTAELRNACKASIGRALRPLVLRRRVRSGRALILMFHRVLGPSPGEQDDPLIVSSSTFEEILGFVMRHFEVVDLLTAASGRGGGRRPRCAITFDDGWADNYTVAYPILRRAGVPATIFLSAGMVDTYDHYWFQRAAHLVNHLSRNDQDLQALLSYAGPLAKCLPARPVDGRRALLHELGLGLKGLHPLHLDTWLDEAERHFGIPPLGGRSILDWSEIREMGAHDISFGSHGMFHRILPRLTREEKDQELAGSYTILRARQINFIPAVSFPNGDYDEDTIAAADAAGYRVLLTAGSRRSRSPNAWKVYPRLNGAVLRPRSLDSMFYHSAVVLNRWS